jgi:hypothetical protein
MKLKEAIATAGLFLCSGVGGLSAGWIDNGVPVCGAAREQRNPRAVSDGAGGAIIVWEDKRGFFSWDLYAQRISSTGDTLWDLDGVPVCAASLDQIDAKLVSDGSGGAFIAWTDYRNGTKNWDVYMQRISPEGQPIWAADGIAVCAEPGLQYAPEIAPDDSGGVIEAWLDSRGGGASYIYAQRISGEGEALWDSSGVVISGGNNARLHILSDGSGGAIIVREEADLYAQRVSRSGIVQWKVNGITVCNAGGNQSRPQLVSDGSGGAIITWMDFRMFAWDIFAQRISASGAALWAPNGIVICAAENDQIVPRIVSDGAGGAIIAWVDGRSGELDIYARAVNAVGAYPWPGGTIPVCTAPLAQQEVEIASDGAGGAIIEWIDGRTGANDIYCQRMSAAGAALWTSGGISACAESGDQDEPGIVSDCYGGAIAVWRDGRIGSADIYAQRIHFNGAITGADENRAPAMRAELLPLAPNPFSGGVAIRFRTDTPGGVALKVFDVSGRLVRDLGRRWAAAGSHSIAWNCRDDTGRRVGSGVYFIQMKAGAGVITRKAVVVQ